MQYAVPVLGLLLGLAAQAQQSESADMTSDAAVAAAESAALASGESGVRIVRLSEVKGIVTFDRKTENGFEPAFANQPIIQGGRLQTREGVAEVEFEDNSTLRITPNSLVEFPVLKASRDGARISSVHLLQGSMYVSLVKSSSKAPGNDFTVTFANQRLTLTPASHILLDLTSAQPKLAVMDGSVLVADGTRTTVVPHKKGLLFDPANQNAPTLVSSNSIALDDRLTEWDKQSVAYHNRAVASSFRGASPYAYGISDLSYYGSFSSIGGCGNMWQPYFASAAFDPFGNGTWAYYPGAGYSFVSPYPWGWTPFHSGSWSYCPASGWGWQPTGGGWTGLNNASLNVNTPTGPRRLKPPHGPVALGGATFVHVHQTPLVASDMSKPDTFVFRKDSAGLGVPRGVFDKLNKVSAQTVQHGSVATPVYTPGPAGGRVAAGPSPASAGSGLGSASSQGSARSTSATLGSAGSAHGTGASPASGRFGGASAGSGSGSGSGSRGAAGGGGGMSAGAAGGHASAGHH